MPGEPARQDPGEHRRRGQWGLFGHHPAPTPSLTASQVLNYNPRRCPRRKTRAWTRGGVTCRRIRGVEDRSCAPPAFSGRPPWGSLEAVFRYMDMINMLPVHYQGMVASNAQTIRRRMANEFGCDPEEMALTRGASEALQIVQNGIDLKAGDEGITTEQDYPRVLTTWGQRRRREAIKVTRLQFPVPATQDYLYNMFEKAITPRTRVFHFCHITNLTAQLFPVQRLSRLARAKGIGTIVDGAHALGHFPFKLRDLECDAYGVSLHK